MTSKDKSLKKAMAAAMKRAISEAGGNVKLAAALGITSQAVSQWRLVPADRVLDVEKACGSKVTRHEMRPDIFGALSQAA
ncbi:transcriptional regulator [Neptunomonas phycophila]|uniref:transcriptional regulator n=1 Tax=Neptunomonas phycophila TaxID=1572645 RepID=UPI003736FED4